MARARAQFPQEPSEAQPSASISASALRSWLRTMAAITAPHRENGAAPVDIPTADRPVFPQRSDSYPSYPSDQPFGFTVAPDDDLDQLCSRLDTLTRRLSRLATRVDDARPATTITPDDPVDAAITEIFARQRVLAKTEPDGPTMFPPPVHVPADHPQPDASPMSPADGAFDLSTLEQQLKLITKQLEILRSPCRAEELVTELRQELAGIAATLELLVPRSAFDALEREVRAMTDRLDSTRGVDADTPSFAKLEQGLADIRDAITTLAPGELGEAVLTLSHRVDQISAVDADPLMLQQLDAAITALRSIVAQVASGDALAALVQEVRQLSEKIDRNLPNEPAPAPPALGHDLLLALEKEVSGIAATLSAKADQAPAPAIEPLIESIIHKLDRFDLFADEETMFAPIKAHLSELGDKIDRLQSPQADPAAVAPLEVKLGHIAETIERMNTEGIERPILAELNERLQAIATKLDRLEENTPGRGDLSPLEQRIAELAEKLGASEARLGNLQGIEHGMAELIGRLDEIRTAAGVDVPSSRPHGASVDTADSVAEEAEAAPSFESDHPAPAAERPIAAPDHQAFAEEPATVAADPLPIAAESPTGPREPSRHWSRDDRFGGQQADEGLAPTDHAYDRAAARSWQSPTPQIEPARPPEVAENRAAIKATEAAAVSTTHGPAKAPTDAANVRADTPIEPGLTPPRFRARHRTAERIVASQAALGPMPADRAAGAKPRPNFIIAARRAAQAASEQQGALAAAAAAGDIASGRKGQGLAKRVRSLFLSGSVILLALGATGILLSISDQQNAANDRPIKLAAVPAPTTIVRKQPAVATAASTTTPETALTAPTESNAPAVQETISSTDQGVPPTPAAAEGKRHTEPPSALALFDATGSLGMPRAPRSSTVPSAQSAPSVQPVTTSKADSWSDPLPPALTTKPLLAGIEAHNPGAAYEIALRYAEGRGIEADMAVAAMWFARAAEGGVVPAQFRLGGLYEKGIGVQKDPAQARRYYLAAAKHGYAHAMHNLAVLYAEGSEGKTDFAAAVKWFRKGAEYGVPDSQYNAAVLLARGIGVEQNLGEAYKWFAIAAKGGDKDAAKKRDEIATRLDAQTLAAARLAASVFVPTPQPAEATAVHAPATGWDDVVVTPKPRAAVRHNGTKAARL